jgi:beta-fructofuranosidase
MLVCQADVEVSFEVPSLDGAETLDPALANDAQKLCGVKGADVEGGVGPFGLWVLASSKLEERTAVFFRVFKVARKPVVLMCSDPTKYVGTSVDNGVFNFAHRYSVVRKFA